MSGESVRTAAERRSRVQRLKIYIVTGIAGLLILPVILCTAMLVQLGKMNEKLERLTQQLSRLTDTLTNDQQESAQLFEYGQSFSGLNEGKQPVAGQEIVEIQDNSTKEDTAGEAVGITEAARKIYLTFDDGPSCYTEDILNILDRYGVKATFFVLGKENESSKEMIREIQERGHTLGMHSYSHVYSEIYESEESFEADLKKIREYLYDITGEECSLYRFPGGSSNSVSKLDMELFAECLDREGICFFDWNATSGDATSDVLSVDRIVTNVMSGIDNHSTVVVLMHDAADKRTTVEALPIIIERIMELEDTVILPITEETERIQHIRK